MLLGAAYPIYRTFKALERRRFLFDNTGDGVLTYWSIFGCLSAAEAASLEPIFQMFPWYYHCKLGFIFWLQSQNGAQKLYKEYLKPFFLKHEEAIDQGLALIDSEVNTHVSQVGADAGKLMEFAVATSRAVSDALVSFFNSR